MQFEKLLNNSEHGCSILFDHDESEVVRAVYREHIVGLARRANVDSISEFDRQMSNHGDDETFPAVQFISAESAVEMINGFHANTADAVIDIAKEASFPDFDNDCIALRLRLGERALGLSQDIAEAAYSGNLMEELSQLTETDTDDK